MNPNNDIAIEQIVSELAKRPGHQRTQIDSESPCCKTVYLNKGTVTLSSEFFGGKNSGRNPGIRLALQRQTLDLVSLDGNHWQTLGSDRLIGDIRAVANLIVKCLNDKNILIDLL